MVLLWMSTERGLPHRIPCKRYSLSLCKGRIFCTSINTSLTRNQVCHVPVPEVTVLGIDYCISPYPVHKLFCYVDMCTSGGRTATLQWPDGRHWFNCVSSVWLCLQYWQCFQSAQFTETKRHVVSEQKKKQSWCLIDLLDWWMYDTCYVPAWCLF